MPLVSEMSDSPFLLSPECFGLKQHFSNVHTDHLGNFHKTPMNLEVLGGAWESTHTEGPWANFQHFLIVSYITVLPMLFLPLYFELVEGGIRTFIHFYILLSARYIVSWPVHSKYL